MPATLGIQILLTAVIITLTCLLAFIGVQVIFILREVHKAAKKLNQTHSPTLYSTQPFTTFNVLEGLVKNQFSSVQHINADALPVTSEKLVEETTSKPFFHITTLQERGRRVFHRLGKPLI